MGIRASNSRDGLYLHWSGHRSTGDPVDSYWARIEDQNKNINTYVPTGSWDTRNGRSRIRAVGYGQTHYKDKYIVISDHPTSGAAHITIYTPGVEYTSSSGYDSLGAFYVNTDFGRSLEKDVMYDISGDGIIQGFANFYISNASVKEGESGYFEISRSRSKNSYNDLSFAVTLNLEWSSESALIGRDWVKGDSSITFLPGEAVKRVYFSTIEDQALEADERFTIKVTSSDSSTLWQNHIIGETPGFISFVTITDDDQPSYSITPQASSVNEGIRFRTNVSTTGVAEGTQLYWTLSGSGIDANDFSAGSLQGSRLVKSDGTITFAHTLANDLTTEGTENLEIKLYSDWARTTQVGDTATVTINDTSLTNPSYYSVADTQAYEGEGLYVQISRTGNVSLAHDLSLSLTNGTAFQGFDFTPPTATVSFLAGESSKLIAIQSIEDTLVEPDEAFSITLSSTDTTALFADDTATLTILNDDAAPVTITNITTNTVNNNQTYLNYNSYSVDNSRNYNIRVGGNINTGGGSFVLGGDGNSVGNSTTTTTINADFKYSGTAGGDRLLGSQGANGEAWAHDFFDAGAGDDFLGGGGGRDVMNGGVGDDELRAGYGHDILDGGVGEDILYGGGGRNTFNNNDDGDFDQLFVLSDYHSHNQSSGRLHNGANADTISSLGEEDRITILGATTDELSIRQLNDGLGIFASGSLEAIVTDSSWSAAALGNNVFGDASRFW